MGYFAIVPEIMYRLVRGTRRNAMRRVVPPHVWCSKNNGTRCSAKRNLITFSFHLPFETTRSTLVEHKIIIFLDNNTLTPPSPPPQTQLHLPRPQHSLHHRPTFWGVRGGSSLSLSHLFSLPLPFPLAFPLILSHSSCISRFSLDLLP
ncbi:hypothetical protein DVH24_010180 [Malus domestica]|uniref:Uncharacterized protein n=1 Tax=Malus domestica TaxID=3750 RepID=A0A498JRQ0_MALDO|nr:hypothetical protein DVH24_010180 [Malus domestica]